MLKKTVFYFTSKEPEQSHYQMVQHQYLKLVVVIFVLRVIGDI